MANATFLLGCAVLVLSLIVVQQLQHRDARSKALKRAIADIDAGRLKYKNDVLARLGELL